MDTNFNRAADAHEPFVQAGTSNRRIAIVLLGVCVLTAAYVFGHKSPLFTGTLQIPGIGLAVSSWIFLGLCVLYLGTKHLVSSLFPLLCTLALSATFGIYANNTLRIMNLPVLIVLTALTCFSLAGGQNLLSARGLGQSLRRLCTSPWPYLFVPFRWLRKHDETSTATSKGFLQGIFLCIPILGIVLILLCDADSEFSATIGRALSTILGGNLAESVWNLLRFAIIALIAFAFIIAQKSWTPSQISRRETRLRPLSLEMLMFALCIIFALFLFVQWNRITNRLPQLDYASTARAGFFQLVVVALITLCVALPALSLYPQNRAVRLLGAVTTLLTMGLVATALWRMVRYIQEYGWTLLRAVTLWGILAITAAMMAALFKCLRPNQPICRVLAVFAIVTWIALNYFNVDARIAEANVRAYQSGKLESLDVDYLAELSPDVLPALRSLDSDEYAREIESIEMNFALKNPGWYDWSLSRRNVNISAASSYVGTWRLQSVAGERAFSSNDNDRYQLNLRSDGSGEFQDPDCKTSLKIEWETTPEGVLIYEMTDFGRSWKSERYTKSGNALIFKAYAKPEYIYQRTSSPQ